VRAIGRASRLLPLDRLTESPSKRGAWPQADNRPGTAGLGLTVTCAVDFRRQSGAEAYSCRGHLPPRLFLACPFCAPTMVGWSYHIPPLVFDALLRRRSFGEGVLHTPHLRHRIRSFDQFQRGAPPRDYHGKPRRSLRQHG